MPYDKVGQESSGPIGLYYRTIGQGARGSRGVDSRQKGVRWLVGGRTSVSTAGLH